MVVAGAAVRIVEIQRQTPHRLRVQDQRQPQVRPLERPRIRFSVVVPFRLRAVAVFHFEKHVPVLVGFHPFHPAPHGIAFLAMRTDPAVDRDRIVGSPAVASGRIGRAEHVPPSAVMPAPVARRTPVFSDEPRPALRHGLRLRIAFPELLKHRHRIVPLVGRVVRYRGPSAAWRGECDAAADLDQSGSVGRAEHASVRHFHDCPHRTFDLRRILDLLDALGVGRIPELDAFAPVSDPKPVFSVQDIVHVTFLQRRGRFPE